MCVFVKNKIIGKGYRSTSDSIWFTVLTNPPQLPQLSDHQLNCAYIIKSTKNLIKIINNDVFVQQNQHR